MNLYKKYKVNPKRAKPGDLLSAAIRHKSYKIVKDSKLKDFGETDTKKRVIRINKQKSKRTGIKGELIDSIVHEINHARKPRKSEKAIQKMTLRSTARMSKKTKGRLYKKLK